MAAESRFRESSIVKDLAMGGTYSLVALIRYVPVGRCFLLDLVTAVGRRDKNSIKDRTSRRNEQPCGKAYSILLPVARSFAEPPLSFGEAGGMVL